MYIADIPLDTPFDTGELARFHAVLRDQSQPLTLEEGEDGTLLFLGRSITPEIFPVYIPPQPLLFDKQFPINGHCLYRAPETQYKWVCPSRFRKLKLSRVGERIDVLFFRDQEPFVRWVRFPATDDPEEERPGDNPLSWREEGEGVAILGASLYRERLHIPAKINGLPVVRVELPHYHFSENLRELVVEEGVGEIMVDLISPHLQVISIPDSVPLRSPPNGITNTLWFQSQPDGPVYFHGYFCGIHGDTGAEELTLKEGTVGVVEGARGGEGLKVLTIPDSVCYMGMGAFKDCRALALVTLPRQSRPLRRGFWDLPGVRFVPSSVPALPEHVPEDEKELTPLRLYQLGRTCPAVVKRIPDGYEAMPPKLRWENGWLGEYWYALENSSSPDFMLLLHIPSGQLVEQRRFHAYPFRKSTFTSAFLPLLYYNSRSYLQACVELIRRGKPPEPGELKEMEQWWHTLVARRLWSWFDLEKARKAAQRHKK